MVLRIGVFVFLEIIPTMAGLHLLGDLWLAVGWPVL